MQLLRELTELVEHNLELRSSPPNVEHSLHSLIPESLLSLTMLLEVLLGELDKGVGLEFWFGTTVVASEDVEVFVLDEELEVSETEDEGMEDAGPEDALDSDKVESLVGEEFLKWERLVMRPRARMAFPVFCQVVSR